MRILSSRARERVCRKLIAISSTVLVILCSVPNRVHAAAGDLDPSFGSGGKVTTSPGGEANSLAIQTDGKLVIVGSLGGFDAVRYNSDGSLDSSFGTGGRVTINFSGTGSQDTAKSVAIQPDGKIVIGGSTTFFRPTFALMRLNINGGLDPSFGVGGKVRTDFAPFGAFINAIALQQDGKIVAAGLRGPSGEQSVSDFALARYNADGSLDSTFGSGGKVATDFLGFDDVANAVAIQPDGKIIAVGYDNLFMFHSPSSLFDFALARYNSDGSLDSSFGSGGRVTTEFFGSYDEARAIVLQPDGKLVVAGAASNSSAFTDFGLVRYNIDGSLDPTFGTGGKVMTDFLSEFERAQALALQPDGKIVAAGLAERQSSARTDFALARYNADGSLDGAFGSGGKVRTDFFGFDDAANAVALQADGKIVAAGRANSDFLQGEFALARYDGVSFDICLQDDTSGNFFQLNSTTGEYQFTNCNGFTLGGTGVLTKRGGIITLQHNGPDRRVLAKSDGAANKGTVSVQVFSGGTTFTIKDRNTLNNNCSCSTH